MAYSPRPNETIQIGQINYEIAPHPAAPGIAYGQEGRQATVYKLLAEDDEKALKVFKPRFRDPSLASLADSIEEYARLPGLQVCERIVLTPQRHRSLLRSEQDLIYAVLMSWIKGTTWIEILSNKDPFSPQHSLDLATAFANILALLEQKNIAHCDLSGSNIIITPNDTLELVDVEGIYTPNIPKPETVLSGSPGYSHPSNHHSSWHPRADRFAGAVLIAEILGWCDDEIRALSWGESYFSPKEIGQESKRYRALINVLQKIWGEAVPDLLSRAWRSTVLSECPTLGEWLIALPDQAREQPSRPATVHLESKGAPDKQEENLPDQEKAVKELKPTTISEQVPKEEDIQRSQECPTCDQKIPAGQDVCPYCEGVINKEENIDIDKETTSNTSSHIKLGGGIIIVVLSFFLVWQLTTNGNANSLPLTSKDQSTPTPHSYIRAEKPTDTVSSTSTPLPTNTVHPTITYTPLPKPTQFPMITQRSPIDGMNMVYVPPGVFRMGSNAGEEDEQPVHTVYLDGYLIDQTEVTNQMFKRFLDEAGMPEEGEKNWLDSPSWTSSNVLSAKHINHPVTFITWYGAKAYCEWAGRRLPTEAEWEKAARGHDGRNYPWGNNEPTCNLARFSDCGGNTLPVGSKPDGASYYGALDMAGNVWEWVSDEYSKEYYNNSPLNNPEGPPPEISSSRVMRGGAWTSMESSLRVSNRHRKLILSGGYDFGSIAYGAHDFGFRCAKDFYRD